MSKNTQYTGNRPSILTPVASSKCNPKKKVFENWLIDRELRALRGDLRTENSKFSNEKFQ